MHIGTALASPPPDPCEGPFGECPAAAEMAPMAPEMASACDPTKPRSCLAQAAVPGCVCGGCRAPPRKNTSGTACLRMPQPPQCAGCCSAFAEAWFFILQVPHYPRPAPQCKWALVHIYIYAPPPKLAAAVVRACVGAWAMEVGMCLFMCISVHSRGYRDRHRSAVRTSLTGICM